MPSCEACESAVGAKDGVLHQVLGVGRVASHPQGGGVEAREQRHHVALEPGAERRRRPAELAGPSTSLARYTGVRTSIAVAAAGRERRGHRPGCAAAVISRQVGGKMRFDGGRRHDGKRAAGRPTVRRLRHAQAPVRALADDPDPAAAPHRVQQRALRRGHLLDRLLASSSSSWRRDRSPGSVTISGSDISGTFDDGGAGHLLLDPALPQLQPGHRRSPISWRPTASRTSSRQPSVLTGLLINILPFALVMLLVYFFIFRRMGGGAAGALNLGKNKVKVYDRKEMKIDLRRRRGRRRGQGRAPRDRGLPEEPEEVPAPGRPDPQGGPAPRAARLRQDPARPGGRR